MSAENQSDSGKDDKGESGAPEEPEKKEEEEVKWADPWSPPSPKEHPFLFVLWVFSLPISFLLAITMPRFVRERKDNGCLIAWLFLLSCLWIGAFTYIMASIYIIFDLNFYLFQIS